MFELCPLSCTVVNCCPVCLFFNLVMLVLFLLLGFNRGKLFTGLFWPSSLLLILFIVVDMLYCYFLIRNDMMWYDIWYMIWYLRRKVFSSQMIWYDMIWYDMIWYDMIWFDLWLNFIQQYSFVLVYDNSIPDVNIWLFHLNFVHPLWKIFGKVLKGGVCV